MPLRINSRRQLAKSQVIRRSVSAILLASGTFYLPTVGAQLTIKEGWSVGQLFGNRFVVKEGMAIAEGDIFVARSDSAGSFAQRGLGVNGSFGLWTDGIIPYEMAGDLPDGVRTSVEAAIAHWNNTSSISLVERAGLTGGAATDYVDFVNGPGCASWVGKQGGNQPIWVSGSCTTGSIIHEIGHAIGLLHEHTRSDRDQFVNVKLDNIQTGKEFNFDVVTGGVTNLGGYDYASIMHYGEFFFSSNGDPTLVPLNPDVEIGQRVSASAGDLSAIDELYGTDLSLIVQIDNATDSSVSGGQVIMNVTNNGTNGAHNLRVTAALPAGSTSFSSVDAWVCQSNDTGSASQVICDLANLSAGQNAQLVLLAAAPVNNETLNAGLLAKTHDTDLSNNGNIVDAEEPVIGQALKEDAINTVAAAGGGGALGFLLLGLGAVSARRYSVLQNHKTQRH